MQNTTLSAGDHIEARCTKCRKNTNHTIIAMADDVPAKVECNTCSGQHKFRPPTVPKKPATRRTVDPKAVEKKEWETLRPTMNSAKAADYSMTGTFKARSLINHPTFGLGLVQRIAGSQKVEVLFEDGVKLLRCK